MKLIANYEIKSDVSVINDDQWLTINHPRELYKARIRNIVRNDFSDAFLLSLNITFEAPAIEKSQDIADECMVDCLNIISLSTGSPVIKHRIKQIIDASPDVTMRDCLFWSDTIQNKDPEPILDTKFIETITKFMSHEMTASLQKALRWYRMGLCANTPDDQYQYFWFALELIATSNKSSHKVNDKCPQCQHPLFCESCKKHPEHKPYMKEKIYDLIRRTNKECPEKMIEQLGETRNRLMHGDTLKDVPQPGFESNEDIVNVLGKVVLNVLVNQFPQEVLKDKLLIGVPGSFIHKTLTGVAHIKTVVPVGVDGELDLSFKGFTMTLETYPPQSAKSSFVSLTNDNFEELRKIIHKKSEYQSLYKRINERIKTIKTIHFGEILSSDMAVILQAFKTDQADESLALVKYIFQNPVPLIDFT